MTDSVATNGGDGASFFTAYLIVVNSLTETLLREVAKACDAPAEGLESEQRRDVCAAVWAMIKVALAASLLSTRQQQVVQDAVSNRLRSRWGETLCTAEGNAGPIEDRAGFYLQQVDPEDPVTTAARIVAILLDTADVPLHQREQHTRILAGLVAHRIVSDVWLFNSWESEGKLGPASIRNA